MRESEAFLHKIEAIQPADFSQNLKKGSVCVAILKPAVEFNSAFDVNDVFWVKGPRSQTVGTLLKAFRQVEPEDVYLYHNVERLSPDRLISQLGTGDKICALEAIYTDDTIEQRARDSLHNIHKYPQIDIGPHRTSTISGRKNSILREIKNDAKTKKGTPSSSSILKPAIPTMGSGIENDREWSKTSIASGQAYSGLSLSSYGSPAPGSSDESVYGAHSLSLAWADFVYDRREYTFRKTQPTTRSLGPQTQSTTRALEPQNDTDVETEWLAFSPRQRQYFIDRSRRGHFQSCREHRAFWIFFYDQARDSEAIGKSPDVNFESMDRFFNTTIAKWLTFESETRGIYHRLLLLDATSVCEVPPLPRGSMLPADLHRERHATQTPESELFDLTTSRDGDQSPEPETALPEKLNVSDLFEGRLVEQLEAGMAKGAEILQSIKQQLESEPSEESEHWLSTVSTLEKQVTKTKTVVGVVGATGAGKSSVINAILDEERLVPTNCMRACTAVVTEISYNHEDVPYRAEIDFISKEDWEKELKISFEDLFDGSGKVSRECTNEDSEAGIAYAKIRAVYPLMTREDMEKTTVENLLAHSNVKKLLGGQRSIEEAECSTFYKQLQRYVDSKEKAFSREKKTAAEKAKARQMEYWPLIRVVRLYVKAPALATGAVLVDLPGVHDSNQARAAVAQGYLKQCTSLWIVAPITRAVDDKSAKTLLGDTFKRQLKMDGGYNSVTFICSKTDDISITEAQDSLGLDGEMAPLYAKSEELETAQGRLKDELQELRDKRSDITSALDSMDEQLEVWEKLAEDLEDGKTVYTPKFNNGNKKRRRSNGSEADRPKKRTRHSEDSDDDFVVNDSDSDSGSTHEQGSDAEDETGEPLTAAAIEEKMSELKASKKEARREKATLEQPIADLKGKIAEIEQERNEIDNELLGKCIKGRNQYSRGAIQQDFASGIRELDQEIAEEEDAANFNPDVDVRDYEDVANSLPVFCVSSRGYQQLMGRLTKDQGASMFQNIDETEVPALQTHCEKLTVTNREIACKRFLNNLSQFLNSLRLWSSSEEPAALLTDEQKKKEAEFLGAQLRNLDTTFENTIISTCSKVSNEISESLYERFPAALQAGKKEADDTQARWGAPINREDRPKGGLYWATYKAAVRRNGVWKDNDFNNDLIEPVIKQMAPGWDKVFARRLPQSFATFANTVFQELTRFHGQIEKRTTQVGSSMATFQMLKQQLTAYREVAKDVGHAAQNLINTRQRDINREFVPVITDAMTPVYYRTTAEAGPGQYKRMKDDMQRHVASSRETMFQDSLNHVKQQLQAMVKEAEHMMMEEFDAVFLAIRRDYESVVLGRHRKRDEEVHLSKQQRKVRQEVFDIVDSVESMMQGVVEKDAMSDPPPSRSDPPNEDEVIQPANDERPMAVDVKTEHSTDDAEDGAETSNKEARSVSNTPDFKTPEEAGIKSEGDEQTTSPPSASPDLSDSEIPMIKDSDGEEDDID